MTTMTLTDAKNRIGEAANLARYQNSRIVLTSHSTPVAAIISIEDLELLQALEDADDLRAALEARRESSQPWERVKKDFSLNE